VVQRRDGPRRLRDHDDGTQDRKYMTYFTVFGRGPSHTGESDKVHTRVFEIREQRDTQTQTRRLQYFAQLLGVTYRKVVIIDRAGGYGKAIGWVRPSDRRLFSSSHRPVGHPKLKYHQRSAKGGNDNCSKVVYRKRTSRVLFCSVL